MSILDIFKAVILGVVEGITEWLPISSTGHMILVNEFVKMNVSDAFMEMFLVVIQLGAILAVLFLYWDKLWPFKSPSKGFIKPDIINLWVKVLIAVVPAAAIGLPFNDLIDEMFYNPWTVAITLIVYGVLFIIIENRNRHRNASIESFSQLTYKTALIIGVFQILALIPGTSRSGATILGAMLIGTSRFIAAEFSFYLAIPVMFGASLLKLLKFGFNFTSIELITLIIGMVVAFIVSIIAIKFLMGYIKKKDFKAFGYYRIVLGILVIWYFIAVK